MSSRVTGVEATAKAVGLARVLFRKQAEAGTKAQAQEVLKRSQVYVPVETGKLKASGRVEWVGNRFGGEGRVIYGSLEDVYYALYVHEDLSKKHAAPTSAKFLEKAVRESRDAMTFLMRQAMGGRVFALDAGERKDTIA